MIIELGHFALILALLLAFLQAAVPMIGAAHGRARWMHFGRQTAWSGFGLCTIALLALMHAYALSDFSVRNVVENSHTLKPLLYKIAGTWGNHEGSMLLWVWMLSFWSAMIAQAAWRLPETFQARTLAFQAMLLIGFMLFVLCASNPFLRLEIAPPEGFGLNPVLQDPALAIHPPFLYAGYVGFSVAFCFAMAALLEKKIDAIWAAFLRPWVLAAWVSLTIGIALGSAWAYYELGWGGFWFWDPVENAALLPWLSGTALLHCLSVLEKRGAMKNWTIFLAILTFSLCLLGAFLVRSGVLTSVHAFALDPARGVFLLVLLAVATGGGLFLYALRAPYIRGAALFRPFSRETVLLLNNVFLFAAVATVFMGTLYPLFMSALGLGSVSVGAPYYTATLVPMLVPFAFLMGLAPAMAWRAGRPDLVLRRLLAPMLLTVVAAVAIIFSPLPSSPLVLAAMIPAVWILLTLGQDVLRKAGNLRGLAYLPARYYGMVIAHAGFAFLIMGAAGATQADSEDIRWMAQGDRARVAGYEFVLLTATSDLGANFNRDKAVFSVRPTTGTAASARYFFMTPEKRWYPESEKATSEAALSLRGLDMLYVVLGDQDEKNSARFVVRIYHHPLIALLFAGATMIALGGLISLTPRYRRRRGT
ncbi:MAG: heme lyase CcmF/NrfE family subunit [Alphaproteobacteria bacterium]|nr:heme lyase CcmF/NrfE family subunit [Alphaproteobacteria bacterium]